MADLRTTKFWLALQQAFGVGSTKINWVLDHSNTAIDFYRSGEKLWRQIEKLTSHELHLLHHPDVSKIETILSDCEQLGCRILTPEDEEYPENLRNIYAMPAVLFVLGSLQFLNEAPLSVAMVGTRRCSSAGLHIAWNIAHDLAVSGTAVVSGLAMGIDASCHLGAIAGKGKTVAVMPCGLETISPPENEYLWHKVVQNGGAVISECPPNMAIDWKRTYHIRNRLISGLAQGVVLVEGRERSGTSITFHHGLEQGRDIFVVPWDITSAAGKWAVELLRQGAVPVSDAKQILEDYELPSMSFPEHRTRKKPPAPPVSAELEQEHEVSFPQTPIEDLGDLERKLLPCLTEEGQYPEQLSEASNLQMDELMQALTGLEMGGWAYAMPGGRYAGRGIRNETNKNVDTKTDNAAVAPSNLS